MERKRCDQRAVRTVVLLLLLLPAILGLTACTAERGKENVPEDDGKVQIGICFDSFLIERWERDRDVFVAAAKELGAEVNVQNANGSLKEQITQIEYLIEKKMDVIVIIGIDGDGLAEVVKEAKEAGIRVIAYDRMIHNADVDLYISFDNEKVGEMMGEAMISYDMPKRKVLMLAGPTEDNNVTLVNSGFSAVMRKNGIEIVDVMYADGWKPELASDYIYNHPGVLDEVDGIMCGNDFLATYVVRVLAERRRAGKLLVTGQDADLEACQRVVEGTQIMTVYKPVEKQAKKAAEAAVLLARGERIAAADISAQISDGSYLIPGIVLEPVAVNRDNIDEVIIESGFHMKEEVYLNVVK